MSTDKRTHIQRHVEKIQNAMVVERLIKHFNGEVELSQTQVNVGLGLIKKYLPDMKAVEHTGEVKQALDVTIKGAQNIATAIKSIITG